MVILHEDCSRKVTPAVRFRGPRCSLAINGRKVGRPVRILHVTAQKPDSTGSGVYLAQTIAALGRLGCDQAVVCGVDAADEISLPSFVEAHPVRFNTPSLPFDVCGMSDEMPYPSTRYRDLTPQMLECFEQAFAQTVEEAIRSFEPDVIVCNHLYLVTAIVRERTRRMGCVCPVVAICHNTCLRQLGQHGLCRERIISAIRDVDKVLALHDEQRVRIASLFGIDRQDIGIIGTGYDASVFSRCGQLGQVLRKKPGSIVYAGKVTYKKGVGSLFDALDILDAPPRSVALRLCGGLGPDYQGGVLEQRMGASRQDVSYAGRLDPRVLADEYRAAELFVLPSFYEGLPLVVVEALACGCKVVVTDLPGLRPWIEQNIPDAPVTYVAAPKMAAVDEPLGCELPAFTERLARAIEHALGQSEEAVDVSSLSWETLGRRLLGCCCALLEG